MAKAVKIIGGDKANRAMKKIIDILQKKKDSKYADFQAKLIPTIDKKIIIGVRTPELKKLAKEMADIFNASYIKINKNISKIIKYKYKSNIKIKNDNKSLQAKSNCWSTKDVEKFLKELPHKYFDEMQLHAFVISELKDCDSCIKYLEKFLPYIDNWATCDQLSPKVFTKNKIDLLKYINKWLKSKETYTVRFGIGMLMKHFLDDDFDKKYLDMVIKAGAKLLNESKSKKSRRTALEARIDANTNPDKYYIEMMRAWFFATALAKQYIATVPIIKNHKLIKWTHNKTIQKANESYRVTASHKKELKSYIVK